MPHDVSAPRPEQAPLLRRRLFVLGALLIPVAFFVLLEGGLRLFGYGDDYPLFVDVPGYPAYRQANPGVGRRYFAPPVVAPGPMRDAFLKEKPAGGYRIFVQGASSAAGYPYSHGGAFSRMLHQRLVQTFPGRPIEVVNTAMDAVNSYTLLDLSREIIAQRPDAVLIYAGHNEYYGALGVGSTESVGPTRAFVGLYLAIDHFRVVQGLRALWARLLAVLAPARSPSATLMEAMVGERAIPYGSPLYRRGLDQYRANLTDLLCRYRDAGVAVYVGTLVSNERHLPPFVSGLAPETDAVAWQARHDAADRLAATGDTARALAVLDSLIRADDTSALAYYRRARLHDAAGRLEQARADYLAAKDRDQLPFRAPEAVNAIVREAAAACGATVVETQAALAAASPGGIVGHELILEHLHPNVEGYLRVADAFYEALRRDGAIGAWEAIVPLEQARRELLVTAFDSLVGELNVRQLRNRWPFQPPGVVQPDTFRVRTLVDSLGLDYLRGRQGWLDAVATLGIRYEEQGDYASALRAALALAQQQPYKARPYLLAGNLLVRMRRPAAAMQCFQAADEREPSAEARRMLGRLHLAGRRPAEAIPWLQRALDLDAADEAALYDLGVAYAAAGRAAEARATAERLLRLEPQHAGARRLLATLAGTP